MRAGRQAVPVSSAAPNAKRNSRAPASGPEEDGGSQIADAHSAAEDDDFARVLDIWWDHVLQFFVQHRATAAFAVWLGVFIFDIMDLHMPAEWLVFTFFSFSVFVQAFGMSVLLFTALTAAMTILNVAVYHLLPFSVNSLLSTVVVCMLLVRGVHGLDSRGWAVTALMSLSRLSTPWCEILPDYLRAPVAAYCASFGLLWIIYHSSSHLERLLDPLCLLLGVIPPLTPQVYIVEICDTNIVVGWPQDSGQCRSIAVGHDTCETTNSICADSSEPVASTLPASSVPLLLEPTTAADQSLAGFGSSANDSIVKLGGLVAVDRRQLPEAQVSHYEVEVNGRIVGSCGHNDVATRICDLQPETTYQIRVWAISQSRGRAPSAPVFVKTLSTHESLAQDRSLLGQQNRHQSLDGLPADLDVLNEEIVASEREIGELNESTEALKVKTETECGELQKAIAELRTRRKEEDNAKAAQRDMIREVEAEKRLLDKEKVKLKSEIAEIASRKQRALDRRRDMEKQTTDYLQSVDLIRAKMERERRDHVHEQAELKSTISELKLEIQKTNQRLDSLSEEQTDITKDLATKQTALAAQDTDNSALDATVKRLVRRRRQLRASQKEAATNVTRLQTEIGSLTSQLNEATLHRKKLESLVARRKQTSQNLSAIARPLPVHPSFIGTSGFDQRSLIMPERTYTPSYPGYSITSVPQNNYSATSRNNTGATSVWHKQASSNVAPFASHAPEASLLFSRSTEHSRTSTTTDHGYNSTLPRQSSEFGDLVGQLDRKGLAFVSGPPASSSLTQSAFIGNDKFTSLSTVGAPGIPHNPVSTGSAAYTIPRPSSVIGSAVAAPSSVAGTVYGQHLQRVTLWENELLLPSSSLSTSTAESSALSILKDTDLAYPTPKRSSCIGECGSLLQRTASPAEQPQLLFSGEVLGMHRPSSTNPPMGMGRPYVEPIGAPARRRRKGLSSPTFLPTRSHDDLPSTSMHAGATGFGLNMKPPPRSESQSCRTSLDHGTTGTSPFDGSLYYQRPFWDKDSSTTSQRSMKDALPPKKAHLPFPDGR
ncbi:hypothetical protein COEREDRAFT_8349 [Coemansia reversa NRRL 1564]|uniref:Uncharacterized protein n=1 Tax=Coemansia reversa (strain ATCC 12441 / NRRL 1564) TaxID=763665 RepID=A0A2G5BC38_COERN|nr:hypothetical protein COEREDRAFT_8349 [Coemansia reversa NRRL 1564]|eukprot:PIA16562.1 hypothetical protein COEREDRAFT_8349 [Coemansia reversa NRRL 1564]